MATKKAAVKAANKLAAMPKLVKSGPSTKGKSNVRDRKLAVAVKKSQFCPTCGQRVN